MRWRGGLLRLWIGVRNRLIVNARFQRWAIRFWPTRIVARRSARALFDLMAGFVYSQVLAAANSLGLFAILAEGPQTIGELAPRLGLTAEAAARLVKACAALGLADQIDASTFALGPLGAALEGNPSLKAMIAHHTMLYDDLADPVALLRGAPQSRRLASFWGYARNPDPTAVAAAEVEAYSALMAATQAFVANEVLDAYPFAQHRCLLDIGGGEGAFAIAAARRCPNLRVIVFDLPAVAARATRRLADAGLAARAQVLGGSFFSDILPTTSDVMTIIRVLHDHDDDAALTLLKCARAAMRDDSVLVIAEPMSDTRGSEPVGDAYFGFYLAAMGSGRPRTEEEIAALLRTAGFRHIARVATHTPMIVRIITARA